MPSHLSANERKLLRSNLKKIRDEYLHIPYYEGRMGASVREVKTILYDAAQNRKFACLSPLAIFEEMESFVQKVSDYEFLKQDVKDGFHDASDFIRIAREEYLDRIDREVRDSIGLYDSAQWEKFIQKYVLHISHLIKNEKVANSMTCLLYTSPSPRD